MYDPKKRKVISYEISGGPGNSAHFRGKVFEGGSTRFGRHLNPFDSVKAPCLSENQGELKFDANGIFYENHSRLGSKVRYIRGGEEVVRDKSFKLEKGDVVLLPATQNPGDNYVIRILGYDENDRPATTPQKNQSYQAPQVKSAPTAAAVNSVQQAIKPQKSQSVQAQAVTSGYLGASKNTHNHYATQNIRAVICGEGGDLEGKTKEFDKYLDELIGTKLVLVRDIPEGVLVACSGVISKRGPTSKGNSFLYAIMPKKQKYSELDIQGCFEKIKEKANSIGVSFKDDPIMEFFDSSTKIKGSNVSRTSHKGTKPLAQ